MVAAAGTWRPPQRLANVIAAVAGGHAAVDRSTRDHAADCTRGSAKQTVAEQAVPDDRARDSADNLAGRGRRAAADFVPISRAAVIMMAVMPRLRGHRE